jgi:ABC-type uncharacterized transport system ATPase component
MNKVNFVIGENGIGNSTLFENKKIFKHNQEGYYLRELTFSENITFFENITSKKTKFRSYLENRFEKCFSTQAINLSGGEKQILSLILTEISNTQKIICLDEADSDLDKDVKNQFYYNNYIGMMLKEYEIFCITHDLDQIINYSHEKNIYLVLNRNKVVKISDIKLKEYSDFKNEKIYELLRKEYENEKHEILF